MITQPPTTPKRVPASIGTLPVWWITPNASNAAYLAACWAQYQTIPVAIRTAFEQTFDPRTSINAQLAKLKLVIGDTDTMYDQFGGGIGRGALVWAGLYEFAYDRVFTATIGLLNTYAGYAIVHEFGHHIDFTYRFLWGTYTQGAPKLTSTEPFVTLWNQSKPTIPTPLYGATNELEWFAECWRCQIQNDPVMFLQLAGGSQARATALRALFVSLLPMPAFTGY